MPDPCLPDPCLPDPWPLRHLVLRTPRLTLRPDDDEGLYELVELALLGIHPPEQMPFGSPWTDQAPEDLVRSTVQHHHRRETGHVGDADPVGAGCRALHPSRVDTARGRAGRLPRHAASVTGMAYFGDLAKEIYLGGLAGERPDLPMTASGLEVAARETMPAEAFSYVIGGASTERTVVANREAFARWRIVPRMLRGITHRDLSTTVLGMSMTSPVLTAPVGALGLVRPDADLAVVRAAAALGVTSVLSTVSSTTLEEVAAAAPDAGRWFQLYWPRDPELAESLVRRAEAAGYRAIVLTVDTWSLGWRPRDLERAHHPFLHGEGIANYLSDPVFRSRLAAPPEESAHAMQMAVRLCVELFGDPALSWAEVSLLRQWTHLPVLVKGICHPDDARAALDQGVEGLVVSNHGGRQLDGARAALDCLPDVVAAIDGRAAVLLDSGIRCGADVLIALALGAQAVLLGRPWVYGLGLAGQRGVEHALRVVLGDLDLTLALAGYASPSELGVFSVVRETVG